MRPLAVTAKIIATQVPPDADRIHSVTVDCGPDGIVIRAFDSSWSFKVLNLLYKD